MALKIKAMLRRWSVGECRELAMVRTGWRGGCVGGGVRKMTGIELYGVRPDESVGASSAEQGGRSEKGGRRQIKRRVRVPCA